MYLCGQMVVGVILESPVCLSVHPYIPTLHSGVRVCDRFVGFVSAHSVILGLKNCFVRLIHLPCEVKKNQRDNPRVYIQ